MIKKTILTLLTTTMIASPFATVAQAGDYKNDRYRDNNRANNQLIVEQWDNGENWKRRQLRERNQRDLNDWERGERELQQEVFREERRMERERRRAERKRLKKRERRRANERRWAEEQRIAKQRLANERRWAEEHRLAEERRKHRHERRHNRHRERDDNGAAIALGVLGLLAGAAIIGSLDDNSTPQYRQQPNPNYVAPNSRNPKIVYSTQLQKWTPAWYAHCRAKYRSFNPKTGNYLGYDGKYHMCK